MGSDKCPDLGGMLSAPQTLETVPQGPCWDRQVQTQAEVPFPQANRLRGPCQGRKLWVVEEHVALAKVQVHVQVFASQSLFPWLENQTLVPTPNPMFSQMWQEAGASPTGHGRALGH